MVAFPISTGSTIPWIEGCERPVVSFGPLGLSYLPDAHPRLSPWASFAPPHRLPFGALGIRPELAPWRLSFEGSVANIRSRSIRVTASQFPTGTDRHRGESPLLPCHTTGHAAPQPAVRRIETGPYDHGRESKRVEVGIGERKGHRRRVRDSPRAECSAGGFGRQVFAHTRFAEFFEPRPSALPLLSHHRPESAT